MWYSLRHSCKSCGRLKTTDLMWMFVKKWDEWITFTIFLRPLVYIVILKFVSTSYYPLFKLLLDIILSLMNPVVKHHKLGLIRIFHSRLGVLGEQLLGFAAQKISIVSKPKLNGFDRERDQLTGALCRRLCYSSLSREASEWNRLCF